MEKFKMDLTWHNCKTYPPKEDWNSCLIYTDGNDIAWCVYNKKFPIKEDELHKYWWADLRRTVQETSEFNTKVNDTYYVPKTANEAIGRLESLKMFCENELESGETGSSIWAGDIAALEIAIEVLERKIKNEV